MHACHAGVALGHKFVHARHAGVALFGSHCCWTGVAAATAGTVMTVPAANAAAAAATTTEEPINIMHSFDYLLADIVAYLQSDIVAMRRMTFQICGAAPCQ